MIYDYLLVGHGLAGSILAHTLATAGNKILVIDQPKANAASQVAAGLMNPLAGKRFAKSWLADTLVPFATQFYRELEQISGSDFFYQKPILKLFSSAEEQNNWMGKSADTHYGDFIKEVFTSLPPSGDVNQEQGGIVIDKGGYLDVPLFLECLREIRSGQQEIRSETFKFEELQIQDSGVQYKDIWARQIIFCDGYQGAKNLFFRWLPFSLNKGEILDIESDFLANEYIYNKAVYVLGLGENKWRVGATYNWRQVDEQISPEGRSELELKLKNLIKKPFSVINQKAGIRPAVRDRRPLIGTHPAYPNVNIFNGMGSKGVMMAPYLAHHFGRVLRGEEELIPEINILRYLALYQEHKLLP